jgi:catechol 2,3-dioxygenase-like lactoylglutathione lyase family enzyme
MRVNGIDHVNISTRDLDASAQFYADILGLEARVPAGMTDRPDILQMGRWLFDSNDNPIVHLRKFESDGTSTGPIDHVALACSGWDEILARIEAKGVEHQVNDGKYVGLRQIFVTDPHGVRLELNFSRG